MYTFENDILLIEGCNDYFYFDPENLIIFSSAKGSEKNRIIQNYKANIKKKSLLKEKKSI